MPHDNECVSLSARLSRCCCHVTSSCALILDVFKASTPYAVVPISNTIQGVVQETLLNLVTPATHEKAEDGTGSAAELKWEIVGSHALPVQHNLVVRQGVRLEDVEWVGSHEQVGLPETRPGNLPFEVLTKAI